jgi:hypothetical protein
MKYTAAMIVLLAFPLVSAPPPRLVREIDLNQIIQAKPDFTGFANFTFSPDEKWLAVAVSANPLDYRRMIRNVAPGPSASLLLVPLDGTAGQPVQIKPGVRPAGAPAWSPDSAMVLVQGLTRNPASPLPDAIAKLWNLRGDELLRRHGPGFDRGRTPRRHPRLPR